MIARATRPRTPPIRSSPIARAMSAAARPRSGGGGSSWPAGRRGRAPPGAAAARSACRPAPRSTRRRRRRSTPTTSWWCASGGRRDRGRAARRPLRPGRRRAPGPAGPAPPDRQHAIGLARRARAWYSGPCLRGSAYSFGLSVQYVPLVVPYQLAPRQSGSNGPSAPSYDVDPRVALLRFVRPLRFGASPGAVPGGSRARRARRPSPSRPPAGDRSVRSCPGPHRLDRFPMTGPWRIPWPDRRSGRSRRRPAAAPPADASGPGGADPRPGGGPWRRPPYARRVAPARPASASQARAGWRWGGRPPSVRGRAADELLVGGLDREEAGQRRRPGGVGMVDLGQPPVGPLDLVGGRAASQPQDAIRVGDRWSSSFGVASGIAVRPAAGSAQPISSRTGASSNSGIVSAPTRPCGSRIVGRW